MKVNPKNIDWKSDENYFFNHPQKQSHLNLRVLDSLSLKGHLFIMTSGTIQKKCIALSKKAFLNSAQSVNQHLKVTKKDSWLISLPLFHVGGIAILARSFLSQSPCFIIKEKWSPYVFLSYLNQHNITLTSLVPTQIYDLVFNHIKAPAHLRVVVVGGDALHENLYKKARQLNWPLVPSYGLTELCSQVATADLNSLKSTQYPPLRILDHCQVQIQKGKIAIQSSALLTGWISLHVQSSVKTEKKQAGEKNSFLDQKIKLQMPIKEGWFISEDAGEVCNNQLKVYGRSQYVKIKGEGVSLDELNDILLDVKIALKASGEYYLLAVPHPRKGCQIDLVSTEKNFDLLLQVRNQFNQRTSSNEKIKNCYFVLDLPKSSLSKVQINKLKQQLGFSLK